MPQGWTDWKRTTSVFRWTRGMMACPSCCYCRIPSKDTEASYWNIEPGTPFEEISYCSPTPRIRCAPGKGCNAEPRKRRGSHLRGGQWDGPPPFLRTRDHTYWNFIE